MDVISTNPSVLSIFSSLCVKQNKNLFVGICVIICRLLVTQLVIFREVEPCFCGVQKIIFCTLFRIPKSIIGPDDFTEFSCVRRLSMIGMVLLRQ